MSKKMARQFTDPFSGLPAFERAIIRLRTFELTLSLFYKEEIEREIVDKIVIGDKFKARTDQKFTPRVSPGSKEKFKKSLDAMISDGAISNDERQEIVTAINFRNDIAHRIDHLFLDLQQGNFLGTHMASEIREKMQIKEFDHSAIFRFEKIRAVLDRTTRTHYNVGTFHRGGHLFFSSTERALKNEISSLKKKLKKLTKQRDALLHRVNEELRRGHEMIRSLTEKDYFSIRFSNSRMTRRGEEICYRLFDEGFCDLSIAHVFDMKLPSVQARRRKWNHLGKRNRKKVDWSALPRKITPPQFDD